MHATEYPYDYRPRQHYCHSQRSLSEPSRTATNTTIGNVPDSQIRTLIAELAMPSETRRASMRFPSENDALSTWSNTPGHTPYRASEISFSTLQSFLRLIHHRFRILVRLLHHLLHLIPSLLQHIRQSRLRSGHGVHLLLLRASSLPYRM